MADREEPRKPLKQAKRLEVKMDDAAAVGVYSNLVMVHQTDSEMVLDFLFLLPGQPKASLRSRVVTSPRHVKRLIGVLQEQVARYEHVHGEVKLPKPPEGLMH